MVGFAYNWTSQLYYFARRYAEASVFAYDGPGWISAIEDGFGGGVGNTRSEFQYNPAGQLRSESRSNDSYAWTGSVAVNRPYSVNGQNQYTSAGAASFTYDANGNLTSDGSTTFTYDPENRLLTASGAKTASLSYDPLGRLFQIWSPATGVTQFLYDGDELVAEYNAYGTMLRRYVHGDADDDPLFWYEGAGLTEPRFPHTNRQGSVTATGGPGGTLLWINTYDEYGIPGANNQGRFQYTGQAWLPELGMYHYKARIYSPTLGRFLQTDPVGYEDQINLYTYVANDPLNHTDPTGRRLLVWGTPEERRQLKAQTLAVAKSDRRLEARYNIMVKSKHDHYIQYAKGDQRSINQSLIPDNAENGIGTETHTHIERGLTRLDDGTPTNEKAIIAHEVLGHGFRADQGTKSNRTDPKTKVKDSEIDATQAENVYRNAVGMQRRGKYGDRDVPKLRNEE
jgi:RHS repeat-associated protein